MELFTFKSDPPRTPYAPVWDYSIGKNHCPTIDVKRLYKLILKKEKSIKKLKDSGEPTDGFTGLGFNTTTAKFKLYNLLSWEDEEVFKLRKIIHQNVLQYNRKLKNETPDTLWIQCWCNIMGFGKSIKPHQHSTHSNTYLSGHFNINVYDTSTVYMPPICQLNNPDVFDIKNQNGDMTIFPSYIFHYTTPHYHLNPRVTIAFDVRYDRYEKNLIRLSPN